MASSRHNDFGHVESPHLGQQIERYLSENDKKGAPFPMVLFFVNWFRRFESFMSQ